MADLNISKSDVTGANDVAGNVITNGDFEIAPSFTAATNTAGRWIDGTAAGSSSTTTRSSYWAVASSGLTASASAQFDSSISNSGSTSIKLSTLDATGNITVSNLMSIAGTTVTWQMFQLLPSTTYLLSAYCKTSNVALNGAYIDIREYNSSGSAVTTNNTNKLSGTNNFTLLTKQITTNASTAFGALLLRNIIPSNVSDAWFDDIVLQPVSRLNGVDVPLGPIVTPGIQDVSGPKIWS